MAWAITSTALLVHLYLVGGFSVEPNQHVAIIGAGWGGLSAAYKLSEDPNIHVTVIEASPRVGGLVRDGFTSMKGNRTAEAGQHGFWHNYHNIYRLFDELNIKSLTDYAEQGQYSPNGLEAVWPVYRDQPVQLPTGLAQAAYTRFLNLPLLDRISAFPLVLAFSEFDHSEETWLKYDEMSFRDLCIKLGVSKRCYNEAFEPMILTGLFAPGNQCSAAAALGMAYFFVLQSQNAFDVQWCKGNIGKVVFDPFVDYLKLRGVEFRTSTKVTGFEVSEKNLSITTVVCMRNSTATSLPVDNVILAVGAKALNAFSRFCPELSRFPEFQRFSNLRGTSVLATRLYLDKKLNIPYSANACWGFDDGIGMTMFDISTIHASADHDGSIIEVDYYNASPLLAQSNEDIVRKVKTDLDTILGSSCKGAAVEDAAIVRLPEAVNWYFPGSYKDLPSLRSQAIPNLYFCGDIVHTNHGAWSQEKAFVTGAQAANLVLCRPQDDGVIPLAKDEVHVAFGKRLVLATKELLFTGTNTPSFVDFLW